MNANENLNGLPESDWTPDELLRYRQALEEAYPRPKVSIRAEVMKKIEAEMAADRAKRRRMRMSRMAKWGSLAACLVLCTTVGIRVLPAVMRGDMKTADHAAEAMFDMAYEANEGEAPAAAAETGILYSMTTGGNPAGSGDVPATAPAEDMDAADNMMQKSMADAVLENAPAETSAATESAIMSASTYAETEAAAEEPAFSPAPGAAKDDFCESVGWSPEAEREVEAVTETESSEITTVIEALWMEGKTEWIMDSVTYTCTAVEGSLSEWTVEAGAAEVEMLGYPAWLLWEADGTGTVQWYDGKTGRIFTVHADGATERDLTKAVHRLILAMDENAN